MLISSVHVMEAKINRKNLGIISMFDMHHIMN